MEHAVVTKRNCLGESACLNEVLRVGTGLAKTSIPERDFLKRKMEEYELLKTEIESLKAEVPEERRTGL